MGPRSSFHSFAGKSASTRAPQNITRRYTYSLCTLYALSILLMCNPTALYTTMAWIQLNLITKHPAMNIQCSYLLAKSHLPQHDIGSLNFSYLCPCSLPSHECLSSRNTGWILLNWSWLESWIENAKKGLSEVLEIRVSFYCTYEHGSAHNARL